MTFFVVWFIVSLFIYAGLIYYWLKKNKQLKKFTQIKDKINDLAAGLDRAKKYEVADDIDDIVSDINE